ncbi:hypothetical protein BP5796_11469 [Coleophoma crateriformis]|uniref:EthD domain-containing protein n=1 Tax=Coleophoma crateriformis TaxID=565419 RepID=A0A3D8QIK6_9HELO|nr:hypothetical protein BP5796_11469 [Coleophoma crateriformis]
MPHKPIPHTFTHPELSYDAKPNIQPCIKLSFFFNKLPEVSHEHFYRHWQTVHADLTVATKDFAICNLKRYVQLAPATPKQIAQTPSLATQAKTALTGLNVLEFDGCSEIWVREWGDWMKFFQSPEWITDLNPDSVHFMALPISVMVGQENLIFGKAIEGMGGTDGILEWREKADGRVQEGEGAMGAAEEGVGAREVRVARE